MFQFFSKGFKRLFCQTIVSWRFVITKTFQPKNHFLFANSFVRNFFSSWLKVESEISLRNSLHTCFLLNKLSKNFSNFLLTSTELSISLLSISNFLTVPCVAFVFSRFRKTLVDFSPSSYRWHKFLQVGFYS